MKTFFTTILVTAGVLLVLLMVYDYRAEVTIKDLKDRYIQIEHFRSDIMHFNEVLTMSARMAAATGDVKWEKRYQQYEPKLSQAIQEAINLSPEIYRKETDRSNIRKFKLLDMEHQAFVLIRHGQGKEAMSILFGEAYEAQRTNYTQAIERLNTLLQKQMNEALNVEHSKEYLARVSLITVLCLLLLSWLIILRIARRVQEELMENNRRLEDKVRERTQSLLDLQAQLLQAEKFSAIGHLAAGLAHEINNPIGFINSNLQTLQQYVAQYNRLLDALNSLERAFTSKDHQRLLQALSLWEKLRQETNFAYMGKDIDSLLKESLEGTGKIGRIVSDLRTLASPDRGVMDPVNLEALMESMLNIVHNEIKYKAELKKEYGYLPPVVCNPQKMGQVFVNLLMNAAQAIQDRGTITVKTYIRDEHACIDIADTGCGVSPDNIMKIFDPLFTTKAPGPSVGMGLSLSYDIVRKHKGTIIFNSKLGEGTTFTVMLPLVPDGVIAHTEKV